jgi:DNA-directed RNA polymerase sigma subunit (sigma70/sigma32)
MKDWRYTYLPDYLMDTLVVTNPEDAIISRLDGEEEGSEPSFSAYDILKILQRKEAEIVESILYDGETFEATGKVMGLSKQRVHQIYKGALLKLKEVIDATTK